MCSWHHECLSQNKTTKQNGSKEGARNAFFKKKKNKSLCHINHRHCYGCCCCLLQRFILFLFREAEGLQTLPNEIKNVKQFSVFFSLRIRVSALACIAYDESCCCCLAIIFLKNKPEKTTTIFCCGARYAKLNSNCSQCILM